MLTAEPLIIARLKAQVPNAADPMPTVRVCSSATVAGVTDIAAICPLVLVHPARADKTERPSDDLLLERQLWKLVVVVKNIPNTREFSANFQEAGALLKAVVLALDGWSPAEAFNALQYAGRLETEVGQGFSEFPIEFETRYTLSTVPAAPSPDAFLTANVKQDINTAQASEPVAEDEIELPQ